MIFKKRLNKKIDKYQTTLREYRFDENEINKLTKLYKTITKISNIFLANLILIAVSASISLILFFIKQANAVDFNELDKFHKNTVYIGSAITGIFVLLNRILTIYLFFKLLLTSSKYVDWKIRLITFLSILPGLSVIFLFIAKFKIKYIYRSKKAKKLNQN